MAGWGDWDGERQKGRHTEAQEVPPDTLTLPAAHSWGAHSVPKVPALFFFERAAAAKSLQSCPTLCDPTDCRPPGSSVLGILQARTLE